MEIWILADDDNFVDIIRLCIEEFNPVVKTFGSMFEIQDLLAENPEFNIASPDFIFIDIGGILGLAGTYGIGHSESIEIHMVKELIKHCPNSIIFIYSAMRLCAKDLVRSLNDRVLHLILDEKMPDEWIREMVFNQIGGGKHD